MCHIKTFIFNFEKKFKNTDPETASVTARGYFFAVFDDSFSFIYWLSPSVCLFYILMTFSAEICPNCPE